jgi:hypothetical protein
MADFKERAKKKITDWLVAERGAVSVPLFDFDRICKSLRPGDVVLVEGCSRVSTIIRHITHSSWTHSSLYVGTPEEIRALGVGDERLEAFNTSPHEPLIVESLLGEGTILAPVSKYRENHLRICRPVGLSDSERREVVIRVLSRLGAHYQARELLESALLLLWEGLTPHRRSRWFDSKMQRTDATICSSMLGQAFMSIGFPVLPLLEQNREGRSRSTLRAFQMLTPRDFDHSPSFEIVKCPVEQTLPVCDVSLSDRPERKREGGLRKSVSGWTLPHWMRRKRRRDARTSTSIPKTDTGPSD